MNEGLLSFYIDGKLVTPSIIDFNINMSTLVPTILTSATESGTYRFINIPTDPYPEYLLQTRMDPPIVLDRKIQAKIEEITDQFNLNSGINNADMDHSRIMTQFFASKQHGIAYYMP